MIRSATFSTDRRRRFELIRDFRDEPVEEICWFGCRTKTVLFVMLNPSKADESQDDPTVRKTVGFARRWGYGRVVVCNLNAIVSTDPWALPPWNGIDLENRAVVEQWLSQADLVVAAWGSVPSSLARTIALGELVYWFRVTAPFAVYCIGTTKHGFPLHPSRAGYTRSPERWEK